MTTKMIFRQAMEKDLPIIKEMLGPWMVEDQTVLERLGNPPCSDSVGEVCCRVLEVQGAIKCASLWTVERPDQVRMLALADVLESSESGAEILFLRQEIMSWASMEVAKAIIRVPTALAGGVVSWLRNCGFLFEGICSSGYNASGTGLTFCKHFRYRSIRRNEVMDFLREFLVSLGYEVRDDVEGFSYRVRPDLHMPFVFSSWHRIMMSGADLVVHPPARVLEWNELENIFYPLAIRSREEKPLLIPMEKKRAGCLMDLSTKDNHQSSLFDRLADLPPQRLDANHLVYVDPAGISTVRKGLPVLFYVNRVGAVGTAKVEDWMTDDARKLYQTVEEIGWAPPGKAEEAAATHGPRTGKVMAIRFQWYRPFKKPVKLDEIRTMDRNFSPQRSRILPSGLFQSIATRGSGGK